MLEKWTGSTDRAVDFVRLSVFAICILVHSSRQACFTYIRHGVVWALDTAQMDVLDTQDIQHCGGTVSNAYIHLLL